VSLEFSPGCWDKKQQLSLHGYGDILKKNLKEYFKRKLLKKEIRKKEELREEKARKEELREEKRSISGTNEKNKFITHCVKYIFKC
jgi:hypothetical protein